MFAYIRAYGMGSIFKVAGILPPSLSLSRLCGLELGIHVTANGPHDDDDVDRVPDANLSAVLGRDLSMGWKTKEGRRGHNAWL